MISEKIVEHWDFSGASGSDKIEALNHRLQAVDAELVEASEALVRIIGDDTSVDTSDLSLSELVGEVEHQISHLRACLENRVPADTAHPTLPTYNDANQMTLDDELKSLRKRLIFADGEIVAKAERQIQRLRLEIETLRNNYDVQVQEGDDLRQRLEALQRTVPTEPAYPTLPTYDAGPYKVRVGSLFVMQPDDTIYSEMTTTVGIDDESAGEFVVVNQRGYTDIGKIAIIPNEWPALATAINLMIAQCRSDK